MNASRAATPHVAPESSWDMPVGAVLSVFLHLVVVLLAIFGLPFIVTEPPQIEEAIPVELAPLGAESASPQPKTEQPPQPKPPEPPKEEAKPEPPKPEPPKREPPKREPPKPEPVKSEQIKAPPPKAQPAKPVKQTPPAAASGGAPSSGETYLQLVATAKAEADVMLDVLHKKGFKAIAVQIPERPELYRVFVGPIADTAVNKTRADLQGSGFPGDKAIKKTF